MRGKVEDGSRRHVVVTVASDLDLDALVIYTLLRHQTVIKKTELWRSMTPQVQMWHFWTLQNNFGWRAVEYRSTGIGRNSTGGTDAGGDERGFAR